jgi:hypothetical protein
MDLALVSTKLGLAAVDVESGNVSYVLNGSNASVVCPVGTVGQGGVAGTRLICCPQLEKALIFYWRLHPTTGMPESSGNVAYNFASPGKFSALVFSSCGGLMFAGTLEGHIYVYQTYANEKNLLRSWRAHNGPVTKLVLRSDDSRLISVGETTTKVYFVPDLFLENPVVKPKLEIEGHSKNITDVLLLDPLRIVTASLDESIKFFSLDKGEQLQHLPVTNGYPTRFAVDNIGNLFVGCSDGTVHALIDDSLVEFTAKHSGAITGLGISMDGSRLVSCCEEDGVKIWDTRERILIHSVVGHNNQLKHSLGMLMLRKPVAMPDSVEEEINKQAQGSMTYVSAIDSYLPPKPLQKTVTEAVHIDIVPLIRAPKRHGVPLTKVKNPILINRASVEDSGIALDPLTKAQNELAKQREITKMWASACASAYERLSTFTEDEVELFLPIGNKKSENPSKKAKKY